MRDILVTLLVFGSLPLILKRPYWGVLVWCWLSYMNPHRLTWGFAYEMPFAQIVAITLVISLIINLEIKKIPVDGMVVIWLFFIIWMTVTTVLAIYQDSAFEYYMRVLKIQIFTFITIMVMNDLKRIHMLIWAICLSIGYFSIKGGVFTLVTGGGYTVWGPPDTFIGENNALALATLMVVPLMYYLYVTTENKWIKRGLMAAILLSIISALGSQSRGALLAVVVLTMYFWWLSKSKIFSGIAIVFLAVLALMFMPESWQERMNTIQNYQEDESAMSRLAAWEYSVNLANSRITGGGFNSFSLDTYMIYYGAVPVAFVAHSIYFSVLAAHGWPGLLLFLLIIWLVWRKLHWVQKNTEDKPELKSYNVMVRMLKLSVIVYLSGGAFLSLAYFDLPWHIFSIALLVRHQVAGLLKEKSEHTSIGRRRLPSRG
jgi:probable O-glycosylation ligase (exosortase A-associated)